MTMQRPEGMQKLALAALVATSALVILAAAVRGIRLFAMSRNQAATQSPNPANYPLGGFPMAGHLAPDFTLSDQFGHPVTLSSLRGHEVVLAFIDSRCKTLCPLTSSIMYNVYVQVNSNGVLEHDPIMFIIDAQGHERLYFETLDSNSQSDLKSQEIGLEDGMKQWLPPSQ